MNTNVGARIADIRKRGKADKGVTEKGPRSPGCHSDENYQKRNRLDKIMGLFYENQDTSTQKINNNNNRLYSFRINRVL